MKRSIIVHGGAGYIKNLPAHKKGVEQAVRAGWKALENGASAQNAMKTAILILEDDPAFDSGYGSYLDLKGDISVEASIMLSNGNSGACSNVSSLRHPIELAIKIMEETDHLLMVGSGADALARRWGMKAEDLRTEKEIIKHKKLLKIISGKAASDEKEYYTKLRPFRDLSDTVGCVAMDDAGAFAVGLSTGGMRGRLPGRIGDTPVLGSGFYAGPSGAVAATGHGEKIMRHVSSYEIYKGIEVEGLKASLQKFLARSDIRDLDIGFIGLDKDGEPVWGHNSAHMSWAYIRDGNYDIFK